MVTFTKQIASLDALVNLIRKFPDKWIFQISRTKNNW